MATGGRRPVDAESDLSDSDGALLPDAGDNAEAGYGQRRPAEWDGAYDGHYEGTDGAYEEGVYEEGAYGEGAYEDGEYEDGEYEDGGGTPGDLVGLSDGGTPGDGGTPSGPYDRGRPARARARQLRRGALIALAVVVVAGLVGFFHVKGEINPSGPQGPLVTVSIPRGASSYRIGQILAARGVVHGPEVWEIYLELEGTGPLQAGTYRMRTNEPYSQAVATLVAGPIATSYKLVVPEGYTVRQIAATLGRMHVGITAAQFEAAALDGQVTSPYQAPGVRSLEGLLFPATYPVTPGETADQLVQYMVSTFDQHAASIGLAAAAARLHRTPYQVVEVASIVEREAKLEGDRGPVASAIYNRLARGMPIGAESTLLYGLGGPKGKVDMTTPNPYNTLLNKGLPPTAIANPGLPSLEAAMNPPQTTFLYWVTVKADGKMGFASTNAQFLQLEASCRAAKLC